MNTKWIIPVIVVLITLIAVDTGVAQHESPVVKQENPFQYKLNHTIPINIPNGFFEKQGGQFYSNIGDFLHVPIDILSHGDSSICEDWDTITGTWVNDIKETFIYDANENIIGHQEFTWNGTGWENDAKDTRSYNANNNVLEQITYSWNGVSWDSTEKTTNTYNINGLLELRITIWYAASTLIKFTYSYDQSNRLIEEIRFNWEDILGWLNSFKKGYAYNSDNKLIEETHYTWVSSNWTAYSIYTYTYDSNGNRIEDMLISWDGLVWQNTYKVTQAYDLNGNPTELIYYEWDGAAWVAQFNYTLAYDGSGNIIQILLDMWNGSGWDNTMKVDVSYLGADWVDYIQYLWSNNTWVNDYRCNFTYDPFIGFTQPASSTKTEMLIFPNPNTGAFTLAVERGEARNFEVRIYNVLGVLCYIQTGNQPMQDAHFVEIDADGLPGGIYTVQLITGRGVTNRKIVIE